MLVQRQYLVPVVSVLAVNNPAGKFLLLQPLSVVTTNLQKEAHVEARCIAAWLMAGHETPSNNLR